MVERHVGPAVLTDIMHAADVFSKRSELTTADSRLVIELHYSLDQHVKAAWEAYQTSRNEDDLVDSLKVLCDVRRAEREAAKEAAKAAKAAPPPPAPAPEPAKPAEPAPVEANEEQPGEDGEN